MAPARVPGTTETVPTSLLKPYPGNPRRGDVEALAASLDTLARSAP